MDTWVLMELLFPMGVRACIFLIILLTAVTGSGLLIASYEYSSFALEEIYLEDILNYLDYNFNRFGEIGLHDFVWTLDSYDLLGVNIPNRTQIIEYLNSIQSDDGTWQNGDMYVTSQILMFYNRSGVKPAKSLEPFFSTVDTWEKVNAHMHEGNYWGQLYLYVNSYLVYKGEVPPWVNEFLANANEKFDSWAYDSHQMTHLLGNLFQLRRPIPRINEVINITLQQQKEDGSWSWDEAETVFTVQTLRYIDNFMAVENASLVDSAISSGLEYVENCYKSVEYEGEIYAGFAYTPSHQYPTPRETAEGIWAVLDPESDIWTRWFVPHALYTFNVPWDDLNYTMVLVGNSTVTNFNFNYSLKQISFNVTGLPTTTGYCNISIPKTFMWSDNASQWNVTVDGSPINELTVTENSTHTLLYFTYSHSTYEVAVEAMYVIPEFPLVILLPLFMIVTLLGVVFAKRRPMRAPQSE